MSRDIISQYYPEITDLVSDQQWEAIIKGYDRGLNEVNDWVAAHTTERTYGTAALRVVMERPQDHDTDKVFVALGEFGNGITNAAVERARIVRNATVPEAALVLLPNDSLDGNVLGLTRRERKQLLRGNADPMVNRVQSLTEEFSDVTIFGPSQGATIGAAYVAHANSPESALAAIEPPNVVRRNHALKLVSDFGQSASMLKQNIGINDAEPTDGHASDVVTQHLNSITPLGTLRYMGGLLLPSNLALRGIMMTDAFQRDISIGLDRGSSVSHVWTKPSLISPRSANSSIAYDLSAYGGYFSQELAGEYADHSSTNVAAVCVAAVSEALKRRRNA